MIKKFLWSAAALTLIGAAQANEEAPVSRTLATGKISIPATGISVIGVNGSAGTGTQVTLGDVLGTSIGTWTGGSSSAVSADQFLYVSGGVLQRAFFQTANFGPFTPGLRALDATTDVSGAVLDENTGVIVFRAAGASVVELTPFSLDVPSGFEIQSGLAPYAWLTVKPTTLNQTKLQNFLTGGSTSAVSADTVRFDTDGDGDIEPGETFFFQTANFGPFTPGWRPVNTPSGPDLGDTVTIAPFQGIIINRQGGPLSADIIAN